MARRTKEEFLEARSLLGTALRLTVPDAHVGRYLAPMARDASNYSADIRGIFCEHCDLLGIDWTQSSFKNISIAHRDSVAILDSFVGPKR